MDLRGRDKGNCWQHERRDALRHPKKSGGPDGWKLKGGRGKMTTTQRNTGKIRKTRLSRGLRVYHRRKKEKEIRGKPLTAALRIGVRWGDEVGGRI